MDYISIIKRDKLNGSVKISGAKNSALPLIASTILAKNLVKISNIPNVVDIKTLLKLLKNLGSEFSFENNELNISTLGIHHTKANYEIIKTMRASILVLGPLLARFRHCEVSLPGGCAIGERPVDLHIKALCKMGAEIDIKNGYIVAEAKNGLKGTEIVFDKITVTGSENVIMAATLSKGHTKIVNVAKEPEVIQLCEVLKASGVDINGIGTDELDIYGTDGELVDFKEISVIPDRIEAGTYLCAGAITNSNIIIDAVNPSHMLSITTKLKEMGFDTIEKDNSIELLPAKEIYPIEIVTAEYPAFPTDMQAQFMALATQANGTSIIEERLFENRFMHASELRRLGADIKTSGRFATINGGQRLFGADVMATDLRASSALILAALVADGVTNIHRIYHLDRGYENLEQKFKNLGVEMERKSESILTS
jgi:UDP-N-acetylglucosamine 1-carboxyvinyltransferase